MTGSRLVLVAAITGLLTLVSLCAVSADGVGTSLAVPVARLIDESATFDGQTVKIEGEIIGDVMKRDSHAWISILDGGVAVGVWTHIENLYAGLSAGGYAMQGDRVRVMGIMHRACSEHGGDLDIHLESIELLAPGHPVMQPVHRIRVLAAGFLCITGGVFALVWRRRERGIGSS